MSETKENAETDRPSAPLIAAGKRPFRRPAFTEHSLKRAAIGATPTIVAPPQEARYYTVLYTKYQPGKKLRKNKTFNDGVLEVLSSKAALFDAEGKPVASGLTLSRDTTSILGSQLVLGSWEVEVDVQLAADKFKRGEAFLARCGLGEKVLSIPPAHVVPAPTHPALPSILHSMKHSLGTNAPFRRPIALRTNVGGNNQQRAAEEHKVLPPLHDPSTPGAVVLNASLWSDGKGRDVSGKSITPVVLDPLLARHMRPHQIEGVKFLYECTAGIRHPANKGAILADSMGLGKTLTSLALVWTLLKQGSTGRPTIAKAIVVTPSSLTNNWRAEARKWIGEERLRTVVLCSGAAGAQAAIDFRAGAVARVAIASYETVRAHGHLLSGCAGLLVCDEGHRLKSAAGNKTIAALQALQTPRRVILTGTPLQNNLSEFFAMCDFVCPDILGSLSVFNRIFGGPIMASRDRDASEAEKELGAARSAELARRVETFVLRRGAEVNAAYLPPLRRFVVFCRPSSEQVRLIREVLGCRDVMRLLDSSSESAFGDQALAVLTTLRKVCTHPALFKGENETSQNGSGDEIVPSLSGKLSVLMALLYSILHVQSSRCVIVSQSTAALDMIQRLCASRGWSFVRIDGSVDPGKRQDIVDAFNRHGVGQVFLLSTTAGGVGLNLTGASRLVLVDSHWNPANDAQAMARIWRDGQKSPCVVYRLVTTGTLEETIYQRQWAKGDMAASLTRAVNNGSSEITVIQDGKFSKEELRRLFALRIDTECDTADVLGHNAFPNVFSSETPGQTVSIGDVALESGLATQAITWVYEETPAGMESGPEEEASFSLPLREEAAKEPEEPPEEYGEAGRNVRSSIDGASQLECDDGIFT